MNLVGIPKRSEISISDFAKAVDVTPTGIIPFEPKLFGMAANNAQMIAEVEATGKTAAAIRELTRRIIGRGDTRKAKCNSTVQPEESLLTRLRHRQVQVAKRRLARRQLTR